jgi:hypothetical protein
MTQWIELSAGLIRTGSEFLLILELQKNWEIRRWIFKVSLLMSQSKNV